MSTISELLTPDAVLITAGQRLARHLAQRYARESRVRGLQLWETPAIMTLGAWLGRQWEHAVDTRASDRLLLTPTQEMVLWEHVVAESERGEILLSPAATARLARKAWTLLHAWCLPRAEIHQAGYDDVQAFAAWAATFEERCRERRWLDGPRLPDALIALIDARQTPIPPRLLLAGFDELTPQQKKLFDVLQRAGCEVATFDGDVSANARVERAALPSMAEEVAAAARWTRARLESDPNARIGVLAPDLAAQHRLIRRVFDDVLLPSVVLPGNDETARPYNLSFGESLLSQPAIATAFLILRLARDTLDCDEITELLCSPYLVGGAVEWTRRARLDLGLRRLGEARSGVSALQRALAMAGDTPRACPILAERLLRFSDACASLPRKQAPSRWLASIAQLLASFGWPGDRGLSSAEYQTVEAWRELLSGFGALDAVMPALSYGEALSRLRRMAQESLFQRETPETPVQILGVLEASGMEFDALWVLGLHDDVWPAAPRPNPFLPAAWQRRHGLPHASAERELEFCRRLTQRLLGSAREVVFSHPLREEDRDLRPSPLIRDLPEWSPPANQTPRYRDVVHRHGGCETFIDEYLPPLTPSVPAPGGAALFRSQAACPFRGGVEFRLGADEFPEPEPGLSAADRGILIHALLARFWQETVSQERLLALAPEALARRTVELAAELVEQLRRQRPETITERGAAIETERLALLAQEWLACEKVRAPFTVRREEAKAWLTVGEVVTATRIDRIDELANGDYAVIDYKTGAVNLKHWFGERPHEPQVPLYAVYGVPRERIGALLYGRVRRGNTGFAGLAVAENITPDVEHYDDKWAAEHGSWDQLIEKWDVTLQSLAQEHRIGFARVSPRDADACKQCHLHAFCRVHERRARLAHAGATEESE